MSVLKNTNCYLAGSIQYDENARNWRQQVREELNKIHVHCFDPFDKPFLYSIDETEEKHDELQKLLIEAVEHDNGFARNELIGRMKKIRRHDLNMIDRSDFVIARITPKVASWGTADELGFCERSRKPVFIVIDDERGVAATPFWLLAMFPLNFFYPSIESALKDIHLIAEGHQDVDEKYWRLLKPEFR